jgi:hypothetical protein
MPTLFIRYGLIHQGFFAKQVIEQSFNLVSLHVPGCASPCKVMMIIIAYGFTLRTPEYVHAVVDGEILATPIGLNNSPDEFNCLDRQGGEVMHDGTSIVDAIVALIIALVASELFIEIRHNERPATIRDILTVSYNLFNL